MSGHDKPAPDPARVVIEHPGVVRADKSGLDDSERAFRRWMERRALADEPEADAPAEEDDEPSLS